MSKAPCKKKCYPSRSVAKKKLKHLKKTKPSHRGLTAVYFCEECEMWHLTSSPKRISMSEVKTLIEIGNEQQCDKGDQNHTHAGQSYFDVYDQLFNDRRFKKLNLLELGVRDGKSLRVWREYFPKANICGVDVNPQCLEVDTKGCKVEICSQDDQDMLELISSKAKGWDIIIDDASHLNELTRKSFEILWKTIRPNGLYIIEDLKVSYADLSNLPENWNFVHLHPEQEKISRANDRKLLDEIFQNLIMGMDLAKNNVRSVQFYHQMVVIQKIGKV